MNLKTLCFTTANLLALFSLAACTITRLDPIETLGAGAGGSTSSTAGSGGGSMSPVDAGAGATALSPSCAGGCTNTVYTLVYEAGAEVLYTFDPTTFVFTKVGPMVCPVPASSSSVGSAMAIDRQGTAWVLFDDLSLFKVDTANAHCVATSFDATGFGENGGGIAFVASTASSAETLYMSIHPDASAAGLITIDPQTLTPTLIGDFDVDLEPMMAGGPQLAGSRDGRLFSTWGGMPILAEIERSTAHILWSTPLPAAVNKGFAPFVWDGDVWVFGDAVGANGSTIHRYDISTGLTTTLGPEAGTGFNVMAAAVSFCAP